MQGERRKKKERRREKEQFLFLSLTVAFPSYRFFTRRTKKPRQKACNPKRTKEKRCVFGTPNSSPALHLTKMTHYNWNEMR